LAHTDFQNANFLYIFELNASAVTLANKVKLENVAIENALQLDAARATSALSDFNYDVMPSLKSQNLFITVL